MSRESAQSKGEKEGPHPGMLKGVTEEPMRKVSAKGRGNRRKTAGDAHGAGGPEPAPVLSTGPSGWGSE